MTALHAPYTVAIPSYVPPPAPVALRLRLLRDGAVTSGEKRLRLYRSYDAVTADDLCLEFWAEDGELSQVCEVSLAALLEQGDWLALGIDDALPRRVRGAYLNFTESGTYTYNITSGEGGGQQGDPGQVAGMVRIERLPADRQIVLLERPVDGEWRLAGYGPTPGGSGTIDVRVVGGDVYAVGLDDYGVGFVPNLSVQAGLRIRPSTYAGWLYEITEPGTLPEAEPAWWPAEGDNAARLLGTARAIAVRYYRPLAHGPIPVELT